MRGAAVTNGLAANLSSRRASSTMSGWTSKITWAPKEFTRATLLISSPTPDLNHSRFSSTKVISAIGVAQICAARRASSSSAVSGRASRIL